MHVIKRFFTNILNGFLQRLVENSPKNFQLFIFGTFLSTNSKDSERENLVGNSTLRQPCMYEK